MSTESRRPTETWERKATCSHIDNNCGGNRAVRVAVRLFRTYRSWSFTCGRICWNSAHRFDRSPRCQVSRHFSLPRISRAEILASASRIPEFVMTASGHFFAAAFFSKPKSSGDIFTLTCTLRFMASCMEFLRLPHNVTIGTLRTHEKRLPAVLSLWAL
jgi:hypothetical protein